MRCTAHGFTLLELLITISIMALATAGVSFALRDSAATGLEREGQRLAAILESARAQSRASGVPVRWHPVVGGFRLDGLPTSPAQPTSTWAWLDSATQAQIETSASTAAEISSPSFALTSAAQGAFVVLGPEPLIAPQQVVLFSPPSPALRVRVITDGLRPFQVQQVP